MNKITPNAQRYHEWVEKYYPTKDWVKFEYKNVNPKNRHTGDCSTRAITELLQIPYQDALKLQYEDSCERCYAIEVKECVGNIVEQYGYTKHKQPKKDDGKKYFVGEIHKLVSCEEMHNGILILLANHWTVVRDFTLFDLWDCRYKTIGNYWTKG